MYFCVMLIDLCIAVQEVQYVIGILSAAKTEPDDDDFDDSDDDSEDEEEDDSKDACDVSIDLIGDMIKQLKGTKLRFVTTKVDPKNLATVLEESDKKSNEDLTVTGLNRVIFKGLQDLAGVLSENKGDDDGKDDNYYQPTFPQNRRVGIFVDRRKDKGRAKRSNKNEMIFLRYDNDDDV